MKAWAICERCGDAQERKFLSGGFGPSGYGEPIGWASVDLHDLCGSCLPVVRTALDEALRPPRTAPKGAI